MKFIEVTELNTKSKMLIPLSVIMYISQSDKGHGIIYYKVFDEHGGQLHTITQETYNEIKGLIRQAEEQR